jgi:hypothetical protein
MGVKIFCTVTIFLFFTVALFFGVSRSFNFYRDAIVSRLRQDSLFLPRRLLLLHRDTFDFTAMPSLVVPRYL